MGAGTLMVLLKPVQAVDLPALVVQMVVFFSTTLVTTGMLVLVVGALVVVGGCEVVEGGGFEVAATRPETV